MGQLAVARDGDSLRTLLGSCVGLALYDRRQRIGGLAHIVLPAARGNAGTPGKFVDTAIPKLIHEMEMLSRGGLRLVAKMAGGASMFSTNAAVNIGMQNVEACERLLLALSIPIVARHCGGTKGRRMSFSTSDGTVLIEVVGKDAFQL